MKNINARSLSYTKRKPYEPVKELFQIPVALYEVLSLVEDAEKDGCKTAAKMRELLASVIDVALDDPEAWIKVENWSRNGYKVVRDEAENLNLSDAG